jgi:hypothetical protein
MPVKSKLCLLIPSLIVICMQLHAAEGPGAGEPALLLIVAGQSNAKGAGLGAWAVPEQLRAIDPKDRIWQPANFAPLTGFQPLQNGVNNQWDRSLTEKSCSWGPEAEFARCFRQAQPNRGLYVVNRAVGGTSLAKTEGGSPDWSPESKGELFDLLGKDVADAQATLKAQGVRFEMAFLWVQGENDSLSEPLAKAYQVNLAALFVAVRSRIGDAKTAILCNKLDDAPRWTFYELVREAEQNVIANLPQAALVETRDLPLQGDQMHFSADGQVLLGARMYEAYAGLQKKKSPETARGKETP